MVIVPAGLRGTAGGARLPRQLAPAPAGRPGQILAGWTMIEVYDTTAAKIALARPILGCPGCGQPPRPWGHARELAGARAAVRPDRALCTGRGATHVVLDAGLLPRRVCAAGLIGQSL